MSASIINEEEIVWVVMRVDLWMEWDEGDVEESRLSK